MNIADSADSDNAYAILMPLLTTEEVPYNGLTRCGQEFDEESFREEHGITKDDYDYPWTAPRRSYRPKPQQP